MVQIEENGVVVLPFNTGDVISDFKITPYLACNSSTDYAINVADSDMEKRGFFAKFQK